LKSFSQICVPGAYHPGAKTFADCLSAPRHLAAKILLKNHSKELAVSAASLRAKLEVPFTQRTSKSLLELYSLYNASPRLHFIRGLLIRSEAFSGESSP